MHFQCISNAFSLHSNTALGPQLRAGARRVPSWGRAQTCSHLLRLPVEVGPSSWSHVFWPPFGHHLAGRQLHALSRGQSAGGQSAGGARASALRGMNETRKARLMARHHDQGCAIKNNSIIFPLRPNMMRNFSLFFLSSPKLCSSSPICSNWRPFPLANSPQSFAQSSPPGAEWAPSLREPKRALNSAQLNQAGLAVFRDDLRPLQASFQLKKRRLRSRVRAQTGVCEQAAFAKGQPKGEKCSPLQHYSNYSNFSSPSAAPNWRQISSSLARGCCAIRLAGGRPIRLELAGTSCNESRLFGRHFLATGRKIPPRQSACKPDTKFPPGGAARLLIIQEAKLHWA